MSLLWGGGLPSMPPAAPICYLPTCTVLANGFLSSWVQCGSAFTLRELSREGERRESPVSQRQSSLSRLFHQYCPTVTRLSASEMS